MRKKWIIIFGLCICLAVTFGYAASPLKHYVGLKYTKVPKGYSTCQTWLISDGYGATYLRKGTENLLWFEKLHSIRNNVLHEVIDSMVLPKMERNDLLVGMTCWRGDVPDPALVALVVFEEVEYFTQIKSVWRFNCQTERIEKVNSKGIRCRNEFFGI